MNGDSLHRAEVSDWLIKALLTAGSSFRGHMDEGGVSIRRTAGSSLSPPGDKRKKSQSKNLLVVYTEDQESTNNFITYFN